MADSASIAHTHVWREHPALAQLLGLCPLLAVTTSVVRALGLAIATSLVLVATSVIVSLLRRLLARELRIMSYVLIVGAQVTVIDLAMLAWLPALHAQLDIFVPLIATNCVILSRSERFAARASAGAALGDALSHAAAITLAFVLFGGLRELVGHGTLFAGFDALRGGDGSAPGIVLFEGGLLLATLMPGAFLALALLSALHRRLVARPMPAAQMSAAIPPG